MGKKYRLATRSSPLAIKQAQMAAEFLSDKIPDSSFEILTYKTGGDRRQDWSLEKMGGNGLFTKELEDALLNNEADIAVHSAKDLPVKVANYLYIAACLPRDAAKDVLAVNENVEIPSLIGTSSPRRRSQLKKMFLQAVWSDIRGSVETRLKKVASNEPNSLQATILSSAGLLRLGIKSFDGVKFTELKTQCCVPAVAQGIIALQTRSDIKDEIENVGDKTAMLCFTLERKFLEALGGGCQAAFAAHYDGEIFHIFHENCGYQKYVFSGTTLPEMLQEIEHIAKALL